MKAGVLPGEKAKWLNSSILRQHSATCLAGGRACAMGSGAPTRTFCFLTAVVGLFASIPPFMWAFVIAMLFLCSSWRRKHNKSLFGGWISCFPPAEPSRAERGSGRTEGVASSLCELALTMTDELMCRKEREPVVSFPDKAPA